ncbi:hypothetical protein TcasGA2_TC034098 [Tribolium castaneum]|uniref:Uncharacterized protein n=1 Tax=Tribolium castaneum TaxID=7070 RepID=A0A139WD55_TRICA|nr:hypothetical protein TcasGA2_TC034098 [Tribolium castaneum]
METKNKQQQRRDHPVDTSNFLSNWLFCWVLPVVGKATKTAITEDSLYATPGNCQARVCAEKLEKFWFLELKGKNPSLTRAIMKSYGFRFFFYGCLFFPVDLASRLFQPYYLQKLLDYYTLSQKGVTQNDALFSALMIVLFPFLRLVTFHTYVAASKILGMKAKVACSSLIYRKCLQLKKNHLQRVTTGQLINLLSNDVRRFDCCDLINFVWIGPAEVLIGIFYVDVTIGRAATSGVLVLILCFFLQLFISKHNSVVRRRIAEKTDHRIGLINDLISGMQIIKMYAWEKPFTKLISIARSLELKEIKTATYMFILNDSFKHTVVKIIILLGVSLAALTGLPLTPQYFFAMASTFENLKMAITLCTPLAITQLSELKTTILRIQKFLLTECHSKEFQIKEAATLGIEIKNLGVKWDNSHDFVLKNLTLTATCGQLTGIVGPAGGGKSTLLQTIIKETKIINGTVSLKGRISYASQEAWIFSASVRQNILFGEAMDEEKYRKVLKVCALEHDLALFPYGDNTLVGERGIMLSGGQKARINLARSVYRDADIYLLDDPLSAVDAQVARIIFKECVQNYLKDKCVVLVTHQVSYLQKATKIYSLTEGRLECIEQLEQSGFAESNPQSHFLQSQVVPTEVNKEEFGNLKTGHVYKTYYCLGVVFMPVLKSAKRTEGITRSPIFSHLTATLQGLATIKAFNAQDTLLKEFEDHQNLHISAQHLVINIYALLSFIADFICNFYVALIIFGFFLLGEGAQVANVGLAIHLGIYVVSLIAFVMITLSNLDSEITSVERVLDYTQLPPELDGTIPPPKAWPSQGRITFRSVSLKYSPTEPPVLKKVSFTIEPGEKIGIVGRTGAGKSSLVSTLFRLFPFEGTILIDNIDTKSIPLKDLRSKISVIPQDPVLFLGTLRKNLDPFDEFTDAELWSALEDVELKSVVRDLDSEVSEGGSNFSVGQKQLLCLVRAMLRRNKIVVLDEATANIDLKTDVLIQSAIRRKFHKATVLTVAHRLNTVMDSDRILVMNDGVVVEFGSPKVLLEDVNGFFYQKLVVSSFESFLMEDKKKAKSLPKHPEDTSNFVSNWLFCWVYPVIIKGSKTEITEDLLYETPESCKASKLGDELQQSWLEELKLKKPSLGRALAKQFGREFAIYGAFFFPVDFSTQLFQPYFLQKLLNYYTPNQTHVSRNDAILSVVMISLMSFIRLLVFHRFFSYVKVLAMKMRVACSSLIYKKCLNLRKTSLQKISTGQLINLVTNDVGTFDYAVMFLHFIWIGPVELIIGTFFIDVTIGQGATIGILVLLEAWIFSASVRQNILFGEEMDEEKYRKVLKVCALEHDLAIFPYGDNTLVGERGVMLSGGQKARINLARSVYRDADIYLLDDPLSAVDAQVARIIFKECVQNYLKDKCVILVTHQLSYLQEATKIYSLKDGRLECIENIDKIPDYIPDSATNAEEVVIKSNERSVLPNENVEERGKLKAIQIYKSQLTATLQGLSTIKAFGAQEILQKEFDKHQNVHSSAFHTIIGVYALLGLIAEFMSALYTTAVSFSFFIFGKEAYIGNVGLAIHLAIQLTGSVEFLMRIWSSLDTEITSVERVLDYTKIPQEIEGNICPPKSWPSKGRISFQSVCLKYSPTDPPVLKNVTFTIKPGEKIGIIGRTGAGKSSLVSTLFHLFPFEGTILIDNVDTKSIPLKDLRSKISVIPQDPVLFLGTLRKNLDPFDEFTDAELWSALEDVELKSVIRDLESEVSEGGSNFSVGQKQLLCLVRAMLRRNKIVVLDEATANIDLKTDELIQLAIRRKFQESTVLTIAHRLNTVLDSDRILVMDGGVVVEFGSPNQLLEDTDSYFYQYFMQGNKNQNLEMK